MSVSIYHIGISAANNKNGRIAPGFLLSGEEGNIIQRSSNSPELKEIGVGDIIEKVEKRRYGGFPKKAQGWVELQAGGGYKGCIKQSTGQLRLTVSRSQLSFRNKESCLKILEEQHGLKCYAGAFVNASDGSPFKFDKFSGDGAKNQLRYEQITKIVASYLYAVLEGDFGLSRLQIPISRNSGQPTSFIYKTDGIESKRVVLILILGSGAVTPGMWTRRRYTVLFLECVSDPAEASAAVVPPTIYPSGILNFSNSLLLNFSASPTVATAPPPTPRSPQVCRMPSLLWGINTSLLPGENVARLWGFSTEKLKKHKFEELNEQKRVYSCGPDALLDLSYYTILMPTLSRFIQSLCANQEYVSDCACSFCSALGPFFKSLLNYAVKRSYMTRNEELLQPNNEIWDMMLQFPASGLKPKGTKDATIQSLPEFFVDEKSVIQSPDPPLLGIYRESVCLVCSDKDEQLLLPIDLTGHPDTDLPTLMNNVLAVCRSTCHNTQHSLDSVRFGRFIIIDYILQDFQQELPSMLPETFTIRGSRFRLNGFIKNPDAHFMAVIKDDSSYLVLDDMIQEERNLLRFTTLQDCLSNLPNSKPLLKGVCLLVYELL